VNTEVTPARRGILVLALIAAVMGYPFVFTSNYAIELGMLVLLGAFLGQAWNVAGGFAGQFSFGHAAFFGTGAYCSAILVSTYGVNPWLAFALAAVSGAVVGGIVGALSFRFGLRGSYFALITLAFAEILRVLADSVPITRGGLGILISADPGWKNLQFESSTGVYYFAAVLCAISLLIAYWLKTSRFGARLAAIRENEAAASALGVNVFWQKVHCLVLSGAMSAVGGAFYVQKYLFIDPYLAYNINRSVEMLLISMIGGAGTIFGPFVGALAIGLIGEGTRALSTAPGLSLVVYGLILILIIGFLPQGLIGLTSKLRRKGASNAS